MGPRSTPTRRCSSQGRPATLANAVRLRRAAPTQTGFLAGVVTEWAHAVWSGVPTLSLMQETLEDAARRLDAAARPWKTERDPAATFLQACRALSWQARVQR